MSHGCKEIISSHGMDQVLPEYFVLSTKRIKCITHGEVILKGCYIHAVVSQWCCISEIFWYKLCEPVLYITILLVAGSIRTH